jgi:hypothetical protein
MDRLSFTKLTVSPEDPFLIAQRRFSKDQCTSFCPVLDTNTSVTIESDNKTELRIAASVDKYDTIRRRALVKMVQHGRAGARAIKHLFDQLLEGEKEPIMLSAYLGRKGSADLRVSWDNCYEFQEEGLIRALYQMSRDRRSELRGRLRRARQR